MYRIKLKWDNYFLNKRILKIGDSVSSQVGGKSLIGTIVALFLKIIILSVSVIVVLFPFYYMLAGSLMTEEEVFDKDNLNLAPSDPQWSNFSKAFESGYIDALLITGSITVTSIVLKIFITMLMGYAFSLAKWRFKKMLWYLLLSTMMLPEIALMSGQFKIVTKLNWREGIMLLSSLSLPFIASIFSALMFRNAFEAIPIRIKEASMIDGSSSLKYFFKVAIPMVSPTTWTVGILTAFAAWNSYMWPSLLLHNSSSDYQVMSTWLFTTGKAIDPNAEHPIKTQIRLAGAIIAILPMFLVYFAMRGRIMRAISRQGSAIKG